MTRAVAVVVERSPGGLHGWHIQVDGRGWLKFCNPTSALAFTARQLDGLSIDPAERFRVMTLLLSELQRVRRAEVTAEVPAGGEYADELPVAGKVNDMLAAERRRAAEARVSR